MLRIAGSDLAGTKIGTQHALARAGFLYFCDYRSLSRCDFAAYRSDEIACGRNLAHLVPDGCERFDSLRGGHFLRFDGKDFIEDVGHCCACI